jgi:hypothetical protein
MEQVNQTCARLGIKPGERILVVRIGTATLQFLRKGARIGAGQPPGMVFKSRVPTGRHFSEIADSDPDAANHNLITTRILWLRGLEPGVNRGGEVDTHARYVYIHGTNHEDRVGEPD